MLQGKISVRCLNATMWAIAAAPGVVLTTT